MFEFFIGEQEIETKGGSNQFTLNLMSESLQQIYIFWGQKSMMFVILLLFPKNLGRISSYIEL